MHEVRFRGVHSGEGDERKQFFADMESGSEIAIQDGVVPDVVMNGDDSLIDAEDPETDIIADRPVRKAKRLLSRQSSSGDSTANNNAQLNKKVLVCSKNSRKSRDGRGRGLPKKGSYLHS